MSDHDEGPIEAGAWADRLTARAVEPGPTPRLYGYDVQADLARHYSFAEIAWLALAGRPPSEGEGRAFEVVASFLAPVTVAEAPGHAAALTQTCGAAPAAVIGVGAVALAEQGERALEDHAELLGWLVHRDGRPPARFEATEAEQASVERLYAALSGTALDPRALPGGLGLLPTCLAALFAMGLETEAQLLSAWVWCRLPCVLAEGFAAPRGRLKEYPMNVPRYAYEADGE